MLHSVPCAHCGHWTCNCGLAAEWFVFNRPWRSGPLGGFAKAPEGPGVEALCDACLERRRRPWWPEEGRLRHITPQDTGGVFWDSSGKLEVP